MPSVAYFIKDLPKPKEGFIFIYALIDPLTKFIFYVGRTNNPKRRYYKHVMIGAHKSNPEKDALVSSFLSLGRLPEMKIIECVDHREWSAAEKFWIANFKSAGAALLNADSGGTCGFKGRPLSEKMRLRISEGLCSFYENRRKTLGFSVFPETTQRIVKANTGQKRGRWRLSEAVIENMRRAQNDPKVIAKRRLKILGFKHTQESKDRISKAMRRSPLHEVSDEVWKSKTDVELSVIFGVTSGAVRSFRHYELKPKAPKIIRPRECNHFNKKISVTSPEGEVFEYASLSLLAEAKNLCIASLSLMRRGLIKSHRGWKLFKQHE